MSIYVEEAEKRFGEQRAQGCQYPGTHGVIVKCDCKPSVVAECWTCCATHDGADSYNGDARCAAALPDDNDACDPLSLDSYGVEIHRAAGHDVRDRKS